MLPEPLYRFTGRAHELLQIERHLLQKQIVILSGFGGVGKTALAREAADWLTQTGMYQRACFVSFEGGRSTATSLLSQIGFLLEVYDGSYTPDDPKKVLVQLQTALKRQRILVIADNLESILPDGEAALDAEGRCELWNVLLELRRLGVGVLLTTRTTAFGDGRLAEGTQVVYLPLAGLARDDAYQLATSVLTALQINRSRTPYHLLQELLRQLGYHPLSLQLVLPALRTYEIWQILQDFVTLLPRFSDDAETGCNRSLLASLEYSLRRLNEMQRGQLQRLAVFEGGAMENILPAITEIAEANWAELRPVLEQAALLTVEQIEGVNISFLRFHPVLTPYLRGKALGQDEALVARYAQGYYVASGYYYVEDKQHPVEIRAIVRRELPNLRRAFGWLLESGDLEQVVKMAHNIGEFLTFSGLYRELLQVHQRVAEALVSRKQSDAGTLTQEEYLHEAGLGKEELRNGHVQAARARFQRLLARIESQSEDNTWGPGSFVHVTMLVEIGRCLRYDGNFSEALQTYRRGIALIEVLVQHNPDNRDILDKQSILLADLGNILLLQGQYIEAKKAYEQALQINERIGINQRNRAVSRYQLGMIAIQQGEYPEARRRYQQAINIFHVIGEPALEAGAWHQLGIVAQREQNWSEAERCFRESLSLNEQLGNRVDAAATCNHLGLVAHSTHRFEEAKGWYQRAIRLAQEADPTSGNYATYLTNLADCLIQEVQMGKVQDVSPQLGEAHKYAEQALAINRILPEQWKTFGLLANIAEMQRHHEEVHAYRRKAREAYASFAGNRYQIDQQFVEFFPRLVAAQDDLEVRAQMEELLAQLEIKGWHVSEALHRIWAGERDWQTLAGELDNEEALLILRVLETLSNL